MSVHDMITNREIGIDLMKKDAFKGGDTSTHVETWLDNAGREAGSAEALKVEEHLASVWKCKENCVDGARQVRERAKELHQGVQESDRVGPYRLR